jgi:hypothetical protein
VALDPTPPGGFCGNWRVTMLQTLRSMGQDPDDTANADMVLGLLAGEAHSSYQAQVTGLEKMSADIIVVDRLMARVGPAATPARRAQGCCRRGARPNLVGPSPGAGILKIAAPRPAAWRSMTRWPTSPASVIH